MPPPNLPQRRIHRLAREAKARLRGCQGVVSRESIAGITADDKLLMDHTPRGLVDPKSGEMVEPLPDARYVALSWDGRTIAQITDNQVRTQMTP